MAKITYLEAIRDALWEEMERDENVFLLGEDIGAYGGAFKVTEGFIQQFGPRRVLDTPMAETAIAGSAIGASGVSTVRTSPNAVPSVCRRSSCVSVV